MVKYSEKLSEKFGIWFWFFLSFFLFLREFRETKQTIPNTKLQRNKRKKGNQMLKGETIKKGGRG